MSTKQALLAPFLLNCPDWATVYPPTNMSLEKNIVKDAKMWVIYFGERSTCSLYIFLAKAMRKFTQSVSTW